MQHIGGAQPPAATVARSNGQWAALAGFALAGLVSLGLMVAATPARAQLQPGVNAPTTFADIVERVSPSVVSIRVTSGTASTRLSSRRNNGRLPFPDLAPDHPLNEFFRDMPRRFGRQAPNRRAPRPRRSQGSGFVISQDGYVVTNNHVVRNADQVTVVFGQKEEYEAEVVGTDARTDLALLKIKAEKSFAPVKFADTEGRVGDWVVAVGNPFGLGGTVTVGVISALARDIGSGPYDFMQIDAAINRGNSGGPTFNMSGEVIGVNTAIYSPSGGNVGIAFAVPASTARTVIEQLKKNGSVSRGWLGVRIQNIDEDIAASLGLAKAAGALINEITSDGPAEKSGLRVGDAIIKVGDKDIADSRDLARTIADYAPYTTVRVAVRRGAQDLTIPVKLGQFPGNATASNARPEGQDKQAEVVALEDLGIEVTNLDDASRKGVLIRDVDPDSAAADKGLTAGDVIVQVNSQDVSRPADVRAAVARVKRLGRPSVLMMIENARGRRLVAVSFNKKKN